MPWHQISCWLKRPPYTMGAAFAGLAGGHVAGIGRFVFHRASQLRSRSCVAIPECGRIGTLPGVVIARAALIGASRCCGWGISLLIYASHHQAWCA